MECDCGHSSDKWVEVKKYGFGSKLESGTFCPICWYFSCFCNVETIKRADSRAYMELKKQAERKLDEMNSPASN